tara:strand:- start:1343 stop:1738 length:396 start_codon:yes stop_codon:yes gene_type:complete
LIEPYQLIGLPYRLGAVPEKHGAADCLTLSKAVLAWYGIESPCPTRSWYKRLRAQDYSIFWEQLELWGIKTDAAKVGTIGLIRAADSSYGLAAFYDDGWLQFKDRQVIWIPCSGLTPVALYCPQSSRSLMP